MNYLMQFQEWDSFFLGLIWSVLGDGSYDVSYFARRDKSGCQWIIPEEVDIQMTVPYQVIWKIDKVSYSCISRIKVSIDKRLAEVISKIVTDINKK